MFLFFIFILFILLLLSFLFSSFVVLFFPVQPLHRKRTHMDFFVDVLEKIQDVCYKKA